MVYLKLHYKNSIEVMYDIKRKHLLREQVSYDNRWMESATCFSLSSWLIVILFVLPFFKFISIFLGVALLATVLFVSNQWQSEHSIANRTKTLLDHCPLKWIRRRESFPLPKLGVLVVLTDGELGTPLLWLWTKIKIIACCLGRESRIKEK